MMAHDRRIANMVWVCRAGVDSIYLGYYLDTKKIYLPWEGFITDLRQYSDISALRTMVKAEKGDATNTSISNWAGQLKNFCFDMQIGDYVMIPHQKSKSYSVAKIKGPYVFDGNNDMGLFHSRLVDIYDYVIPREAFSQSLRYSLGAYRTVFRIRQEKELLLAINGYLEGGANRHD